MSLNVAISSLAYLVHSPVHRHRLRQSEGEHIREQWCEIFFFFICKFFLSFFKVYTLNATKL